MLGGSDDMFWREEYNSTEWHQACKARFGVKPWARWAQVRGRGRGGLQWGRL